MKITFLGTTVLLFDDGVDQILFDAGVTRPSIMTVAFGKLRTNEALVDELIEKYKINRLRGIFISHSHMDHVMDVHAFSNKTGASVYGSKSTLNVARGGNVPENRLNEFEDGQEIGVGNFKIRVLSSKHSPTGWYNNDIGISIDKPLLQPARKREYTEGGSFDFLVEHAGRRYYIKPSCNFVEGKLDNVKADVFFFGVTGIAAMSEKDVNKLFEQTIDKLEPDIVIPVHWDDFFVDLNKPIRYLSPAKGDSKKSLQIMKEYCEGKNIGFTIMKPLSDMKF